MTLMLLALLGCEKEVPERQWDLVALPEFDMSGDVLELVRHGDTLLALERAGEIRVFDFDGTLRGTIPIDVWEGDACGLISLALDPGFDTNGLAFFGACESSKKSGIFRVHLDLQAITATDRVEILTAEEPEASEPWHNVGWLGFDREGALIALFGDKTSTPNGQRTDTVLGGTVRILPSRVPGVGGYEPHPDNPFVGGGGHPAVYSWGLRSPWTGLFDTQGGLWVGDVGSGEVGWEEVNYVQAGDNHGWGTHEGDCGADCAGTVPPVRTWPHTSGHELFADDPELEATIQRVAWVGQGHDGTGPDPYDGRLTDRVLYGDLCLGFTRSFLPTASGGATDDRFELHLSPSAWVQGPDGYLYATQLSACGSARLTGKTDFYRLERRRP